MGAFRDGWAPAQEGELSTPYLPLGIPPRPAEVPLRRKRKRLALSARPKLGSKADQQHRGTSSRRPLSSATHVPQPVDFEGGIASTPTPSSSSWGAPTPRLPLTEAVLVPKAEPQLGDVPLPAFKSEVSRKRSRDPEPERPVTWRVVQHLVSRKLHAARVGADRTACVWWTCGTPEAPTLNADFSAVPSRDLDCCSRCLTLWDGISSK